MRIALQVAVSGGVLIVLLVQVDIEATIDVIRASDFGWFALALVTFLAPTWLMAWRWQLLLRSRGIDEPLGWLTRIYFVGYAASQVLPTSMGGDAVRIVEHARRRSDVKAEVAGAVLIERMVGAAGTLVLVAVGLAVAIGRYEDIELLVWAELFGVLVVRARRRPPVLAPGARRPSGPRLPARAAAAPPGAGGERPHRPARLPGRKARARDRARADARDPARADGLDLVLRPRPSALDLSPLVYLILGPLLFFVVLVPFTINGLGVREAFFVAFLGRFGVDPDVAFAVGFLYYAVTILTALPGVVFLLWRPDRPAPLQTADPPVGAPRPTTRFRA